MFKPKNRSLYEISIELRAGLVEYLPEFFSFSFFLSFFLVLRLVMGMACHCQDCTQNTLMEIWSFIPWKDMVQMLLSGLR
mgnify:CR=1 FL=1